MAREKLKSLRKLRSLSQAALGKLCDFTAAEISRIECGYRDLSPEEIKALASALKVSPEELLDGGPAPAKEAPPPAPAPAPATLSPSKGMATAAAATTKPSPPPPAEKPLPTGTDLSDPANFGVLPNLQLLESGSLDALTFRARLLPEMARAKTILHTSRVPAAVWRAWRDFERRATERLASQVSPVPVVALPPPPAPRPVVAPKQTQPANHTDSAKTESKSFNALFVEAARRLLPANIVENLNQAAEKLRQADPTVGFMKRFREQAEKELTLDLLEKVKAEASVQASSPERSRARRGRSRPPEASASGSQR